MIEPTQVIITTTDPHLTRGGHTVEETVGKLANAGHPECVTLVEALNRFDDSRPEGPTALPFSMAAAAISLWVVALPLAFVAGLIEEPLPQSTIIVVALAALGFSCALAWRATRKEPKT